MDKIKIKRLSDEMKCQTATEFIMKSDVITNSAIEIIGKLNELVEGHNELMDKRNELVEGYSEIIRRLERINHFLATHQHINGKCGTIEQKDK